MPAQDLPLLPRQREILHSLRSQSREILVCGEGGGKSHALRSIAVLYAWAHKASTCVIIHPHDDELRRQHIEGPHGIKSLLSGPAQHGEVDLRTATNEARFANGSKLIWVSLNRQSEVRRLQQIDCIDFAFVDNADRVASDQYELIQTKMSHSLVGGKSVVAAEGMAGWIRDHWSVNGSSGRSVIETRRDDLPEKFRQQSAQPTLVEFLDNLGVPWLAPDSVFRQATHIKVILNLLQRWFWGEFDRLMVLISTQQGKTSCGARSIVPYIVSCRPYETVGIASYADSKAYDRNRDARDYYLKSGGSLLQGATGTDYWKTPYGGGCWGAGTMAGQSGNPLHWGVVDDADKDMEESMSAAAVRRKDNWYRYVWLGRESKFTQVRLKQLWLATRMWRGDTMGRVLEYHAEMGESWHIAAFPALYDPKVAEYYENLAPGLITVEPDWRTEVNEPINPEMQDREYWETKKRGSVRIFMARDQQMPEDLEGGSSFNEDWPIDLAKDPAFAAGMSPRKAYDFPIRCWDLAATAGGGDWTASNSAGEDKASGRLVIRHAAKARLSDRGVLRFIAGTMLLDGQEVTVVIPEDPAAAGKQQTGRIVDYLNRVCRSVTIECSPCSGSKCVKCDGSGSLKFRLPNIRTVSTKEGIYERFLLFADRARPVSSSVEGKVDFVDAEWRPKLEDAVPWFWQAVEKVEDRDWQAELKEIHKLMTRFVSGSDPDLIWCKWQKPFFHECHLYPDVDHDDWAASVAHMAGMILGPRSAYGSGD